ncbi:MAG: hypothetical protein KatS3mg023_1984 [Armatimonadota bacterium]|nr:MAG: hypothetical protein KatS3mg023_1984 [Armatimonadota bacterium]
MKRTLVSAGEVREALGGVSYERVRALRLAGKIKGVKARSGWLYDAESVQDYIRQRAAWRRGRGRRKNEAR